MQIKIIKLTFFYTLRGHQFTSIRSRFDTKHPCIKCGASFV